MFNFDIRIKFYFQRRGEKIAVASFYTNIFYSYE